ncbi:MAG: hypothetical protein WHS64_05740 [Fervidobacterium sp.]|uniref:Uncharacterized protein n=1 Tax=Fervidobacterium gondwanense DSM 13020 TaxID=1121883 RepID=A0A1M7SI22_FERGO|nr:hypothetical protein [Fervidobacterium gondwanense]UXF01637.1 hypothetical protein IB67_08950 [Fervidobacterium riparium]SHN58138.1 hypothetical protein SAMN02745226_00892 [Fervidobacterium gondwanense DSM 13020]
MVKKFNSSLSVIFILSLCLLPSALKADILVLFNSNGLLYKTVDDGFVLPENWEVVLTTAQKWYVETREVQPKYQIPAELPLGTYHMIGEKLVAEDGQIYVNTPFGLAKVIESGKSERILRVSSKSDVLFSVPGGYKIYYTLKNNVLEQFFAIDSPVDKAYVILSTAPGEQQVMYNKVAMVAESAMAEEYGAAGRKIFVLGNLEGLKRGIHLKNKSLQITRRDVNLIRLSYSYSYDWRPADYVVEIKTGEELPAGEVYVFSEILGNSIPVGLARMPDINKEGSLTVSKSWQIYHSWNLIKTTKAGGRVYITGELNLKGNGLTKVQIYAKGLSNLTVSGGTVTKSTADLAEIELPVSGVAKVQISFNYLIE